MNPWKNTLIMALVSLSLFFVLALADDYRNIKQNFILFFFQDSAKGSKPAEQELSALLIFFNQELSKIYLKGDPALVDLLPAGEIFRQRLKQELAFLRQQKKALRIMVKNIMVKKMKKVSEGELLVKTEETVELSRLSLNEGRGLDSVSTFRQTMNYKLERSSGRWIILEAEPLKD